MLKFLAAIGILAIVVALAAAVFFFGGFYNVAAAVGEPDWAKWGLVRVRQASIGRHAGKETPLTPPIALNDQRNVSAGARAFYQRGCVACHGAPGVQWAKFSEGLRPDPPDLKELANELSPQAIFWVVKNGINMTGMPSFGAIEVPDQEIWTIVAFVKKLPEVSEQDFKTWTAGAAAPGAGQ